ncbi:hypothetical protein [Bacillus alkalicellulosilyticus]|uniref:hypothetical protein n=1 Tax=Alkalihalobacterium alkalicellulosilyticum TaxID=1912214 RepID=UPI000998CCDC|nr:hypothetical protein [Bacillus alkalicellulosilyticus]
MKLDKKISGFTTSGKTEIGINNSIIFELESLIGKIEAKRGTSKKNIEWFEKGLELVYTNGFLLERRANNAGKIGDLSLIKNFMNLSNSALYQTSPYDMLLKKVG